MKFWEDKKVLVTGAKGFVGTHLCDRLLAEECDLIQIESHPYDLRIKTVVKNMFRNAGKLDYVFNLAARVGGIGYNMRHPYTLFYDNLLLNSNIIDVAKDSGVGKFIQVGTTCFTKDTLVRVENSFKKINQIKTGDCVEGQVNPSKVIRLFEKNYEGDIIIIKPLTGEEIRSTPEHPFSVKREHELIWINASDIQINDNLLLKVPHRIMRDEVYLSVPSALPRTKKRCPSRLHIDNDLAWLLGIYLAEGSVNDGRGKPQEIQLSCHTDEIDIQEKIRRVVENKFGLNIGIKKNKGKSMALVFSNNQLAKLFRNIFYVDNGRYSYNKIVPNEIFYTPNSIIASFLRGYFDGDGHIGFRDYKDGKSINLASSVSVSRTLSYQIKDLLLWLKIIPAIHKRKGGLSRIEGRTVNAKDSWELRITGKDVDKFIILIYPELTNNLPKQRRDSRYNKVFNNGFIEVPVFNTKREFSKTTVYNIQTESETYTANGTIVHNCSYPKFAMIPFNETEFWDGYPEETNAPYGIAKRAALAQIQAARKEYNFKGIYLIPTNLYGPGDEFNPTKSHVIPALIRKCVTAILENKSEVEVWGTGNATRDFLYVGDLVEALLLAAERYDGYDPINIGSGIEVRISTLVHIIQQVTGFEGNIVWNQSKPDGQPRRKLSIARASDILNWQPTTTLNEGLSRTVEWYRSEELQLA